MTGPGSSGFVPYWGVSDLSPNKSHVLEITLYVEWFLTSKTSSEVTNQSHSTSMLSCKNLYAAFFSKTENIHSFTHEVSDDSPTVSQPITTKASLLTAAGATTGTLSPPRNSPTVPPNKLSSVALNVGGALHSSSRVSKRISYNLSYVWDEGNHVVTGEGFQARYRWMRRHVYSPRIHTRARLRCMVAERELKSSMVLTWRWVKTCLVQEVVMTSLR